MRHAKVVTWHDNRYEELRRVGNYRMLFGTVDEGHYQIQCKVAGRWEFTTLRENYRSAFIAMNVYLLDK
jgi:hypothetical protein